MPRSPLSTYRFFKRLLDGLAIALFVLGCLFLVYAICSRFIPDVFNSSSMLAIHLIYKYIVLSVSILFLLSAAVVAICTLWCKTDEEQLFEDKVNYILNKSTMPHRSTSPSSLLSPDYQPLKNICEDKRLRVTDYLRNLPDSATKQGAINLALMVQHLVALSKMGYLDISDKPRLRQWISALTGKQVPSSSQFNEAFANVSISKVLKAESALRDILT